VKVAEKVSQGIKSSGQYIQKRIKKREVKDVNPSTLGKIKIAKVATSAAYTFTKAQVQGLMAVASAIVTELGNNFENSETGKKWQENPNYDKAKVIGKSSLYATVAVFDGMVEALCIMGRGLGEATTDMVTVRYGGQMGEATREGLDAAGNMGMILKAYQVEGAKIVEEKTTKKNV